MKMNLIEIMPKRSDRPSPHNQRSLIFWPHFKRDPIELAPIWPMIYIHSHRGDSLIYSSIQILDQAKIDVGGVPNQANNPTELF